MRKFQLYFSFSFSFLLLLLIVNFNLYSQNIDDLDVEEITYTIDGETKTVNACLFVYMQHRIFIEGKSENTWMITEIRMKTINEKNEFGKWSKWQRQDELPKPYFKNNELTEYAEYLINGKYYESERDGKKILIEFYKPSDNHIYWWENRKYLNFMSKMYLVIE